MDHVFFDLLAAIDARMIGFYSHGAAAMQAYLRPLLKGLLVFYLMLWVWKTMYGDHDDVLRSGVRRMFRVLVVLGFAFSTPIYVGKIALWVYALPDSWVAAISTTSATSVGSVLDGMFIRGMDLAVEFKDLGSGVVDTVYYSLLGVIVMIVTCLLVGLVFALLVIVKVGLALMISVGPGFILLLLFDATRSLFDGWIRQTATFIFEYVCIVVVASLAFDFLTPILAWTKNNTQNGFYAFAPVLAVGVAIFLIMKQVPLWARGVTGGWHTDTGGLFGYVGRYSSGALRSAGSAVGSLRGRGDAPPPVQSASASPSPAKDNSPAYVWQPPYRSASTQHHHHHPPQIGHDNVIDAE